MKLRSALALALALAFASPAAAQETRGTTPLSGAKGGTNNSSMQFSGPTGPIKTYILPNASDTIDLISQAQTLSNKTLSAPIIASGTPTGAGALGFGSGTINFGDGTVNHIVVTQDQTQTLAGKTLTSPTINTPTINTPTITSPTVTGAFTATGLITFADLASASLATAAQYIAANANTLVTPAVAFTSELAVTFSATPTFDFSTFINASITLTGNITTMNVANVKAGQAGTIAFIQDGTGSRTTVFNTVFKFAGGATPSLTTATPNAVDILSYSCRSATFCVASMLNNVH